MGLDWKTLLSPVTTITRMPAVMHESIAFLTSSLGGSSIPTFKIRGKQINAKKKPERKLGASNYDIKNEFKERSSNQTKA